MGWYVHLSVVFAARSNDGIAKLARKHRARWLEGGNREAQWFLDALSDRTGENYGPKGGLSLWGIVGNYTRAGEFVDALRPFFSELLLSDIDGGPSEFEHILVFSEQEQSEQAMAHEIYLRDGELVVAEHKCPFAWMQF